MKNDRSIKISELAYKILILEKQRTNIPIKYIIDKLVKNGNIRRVK